jgi:hypothetical protein
VLDMMGDCRSDLTISLTTLWRKANLLVVDDYVGVGKAIETEQKRT